MRSPDEASGLMAALQAGWQRGRHDDLDIGHDDWRTGAFAAEPYPDDREDQR
jgi:hypothetical protein